MAKPRHRLYDFPPLYTLQVNAQSRQKQLETWAEIILGECAATRQPMVDVATFGLFRNDKIDRTLSPDDAKVVMDFLVKSDRAEWEDGDLKQRCRVFFRSLAECAAALYKNVTATGRIGDVFTMKEIRDALPSAIAAALDDYAIRKMLSLMEDDGRARTFERGGRVGATFFAAASVQ